MVLRRCCPAALRRKSTSGTFLLNRPSGQLTLNSGTAKAEIDVAGDRLVPEPAGGTAAPRRAEPRAAAYDTVLDGPSGTLRILHHPSLLTLGIVFVAIPILTPFPDIAVHIVQTPAIGKLFAYRVCLSPRILLMPSILAQQLLIVPKTICRLTPCPAGVFPLGFGGQAIGLADFLT